jgi:hypothetical protein
LILLPHEIILKKLYKHKGELTGVISFLMLQLKFKEVLGWEKERFFEIEYKRIAYSLVLYRFVTQI